MKSLPERPTMDDAPLDVRGTIDDASHPDLQLLVPFSKRYTPVSTDFVPKLPAQRAATYEPWSLYDILVPAAVNAIEAWTTAEMSNLQALRNSGAAVQDCDRVGPPSPFGTCLLAAAYDALHGHNRDVLRSGNTADGVGSQAMADGSAMDGAVVVQMRDDNYSYRPASGLPQAPPNPYHYALITTITKIILALCCNPTL